MIECLIVGDSIAVGLAKHRPECVAYAKGGINTYQFNRMYTDKVLQAKVVIISIGSNDHQYVKTKEELLRIRCRISADKVYWIMPQGNLKASNVPIEKIQGMISKIATTMGDGVINFTASPDKIHPSNKEYKHIASESVR
jgi:hypothetical protein